MHYEIITNPVSGSGKGRQVSRKVQQVLHQKRLSFHINVSHHAGQPRQLAQQFARQSLTDTCLIVIGGDGTLHEVVDGLLNTQQKSPLPVAYIPAGTGNDFARGYGIARKPLIALQRILYVRHLHWINVGHFVNSHHQSGIFLNNFGTGFDATIVHRTNTSRVKKFLNQHHLGTLSYVVKAIGVLIHQPSFTVKVTTHDQTETFQQAYLVVTSNHPFIGGGIQIAPDESIDRSELELVVLEKKHFITLLSSMIMFAASKVTKSRHARVFRGSQLQYSVSPAQHGQIDGEELGCHPFNLTMTCQKYPFLEQSIRTK